MPSGRKTTQLANLLVSTVIEVTVASVKLEPLFELEGPNPGSLGTAVLPASPGVVPQLSWPTGGTNQMVSAAVVI